MNFPKLENTPIKEIIFSISFDEIVDKECFESFIRLDFIKKKFNEFNPIAILEFTNQNTNHSINYTGYNLKNKDEVLQLKTGSLSYHFLNSYRDFDDILHALINFWNNFIGVTNQIMVATSISVRYINVLENDKSIQESRLIQLYPVQTSDRNILSFQNAVHFTYKEHQKYIISVVSSKPQEDLLLLDININSEVPNDNNNLVELFKPLQDIKNRVFFDSITANALIKYIDKN